MIPLELQVFDRYRVAVVAVHTPPEHLIDQVLQNPLPLVLRCRYQAIVFEEPRFDEIAILGYNRAADSLRV